MQYLKKLFRKRFSHLKTRTIGSLLKFNDYYLNPKFRFEIMFMLLSEMQVFFIFIICRIFFFFFYQARCRSVYFEKIVKVRR